MAQIAAVCERPNRIATWAVRGLGGIAGLLAELESEGIEYTPEQLREIERLADLIRDLAHKARQRT